MAKCNQLTPLPFKGLTLSKIQVGCAFVMVQACWFVAARSSNGSQSNSSGPQLLTAQDEKLGFEAAVAALGQNLSVAVCCLC